MNHARLNHLIQFQQPMRDPTNEPSREPIQKPPIIEWKSTNQRTACGNANHLMTMCRSTRGNAEWKSTK